MTGSRGSHKTSLLSEYTHNYISGVVAKLYALIIWKSIIKTLLVTFGDTNIPI